MKFEQTWINLDGIRTPIIIDKDAPAGRNGVCTLWVSGGLFSEPKINQERCALIVAAPELLAVCKLVVEQLHDNIYLGIREAAINAINITRKNMSDKETNPAIIDQQNGVPIGQIQANLENGVYDQPQVIVASELKWSRDVPTKPGAYWWRRYKFKANEICKVHKTDSGELRVRFPWSLESASVKEMTRTPHGTGKVGEWFGPITEPDTPNILESDNDRK